ncbi:hypothetical protein ACIRSF_34150 [Streptomyces rubiginosohelvolus]|uniref:hypothetical protein n=1 Tax=Streptomyces rubiginosohelvolus TaxID=67362 RepID=UPI0037FA456C
MATHWEFVRLECVKPSEPYGDELYILQNGTKIWNTTHDNEGQAGKIWEPGTLYKLDQDADIQLWEYDPDTPDDLLGHTYIVPSQAGQGVKTVDFTGDEGLCKFTYKVVRV